MSIHLSHCGHFLINVIFLLALSGNKVVYAVEVLPPVTVTAKTSLPNQINNPEYLDEQDITVAHERTITDVIQGFTGVSSTKVGSFGMPAMLFLRGAGGQGVITLDGVPLLQTLPGFYNLDALPAEAIQSAEIVKGPDSALRSFQALGGAVHLSTFDRHSTGGKLSVEGGSFGILRETLQAGLAGSLGRATATLSRTDAFEGMHAVDARSALSAIPCILPRAYSGLMPISAKRLTGKAQCFTGIQG